MPDNQRTERDSMGIVLVPQDAYYGSQTQRAVENFPISRRPLPSPLIHALGLVKFACGVVNRDLARFGGTRPLTDDQITALLKAAEEVATGRLDDQFPIDIYQTGSGTSSNMNANEVIANRAIELSGGDRFDATKTIHPNDHVNLGQSSNDVIPTAIHVAVALAIRDGLIPQLRRLSETLTEKSNAWMSVIKIGRTHLMDATPLTLGQEFSGFARQIELAVGRAEQAIDSVLELPIGGTAVGTGLNTHPEFGKRVAAFLAERTGIPFVETANHFESAAQRDGLVDCHGRLRTIAISLFNVANNLRWLGSGPRCAFSEIRLPERQPGSSIMPGKTNPVLCESVMQVAARVMGNDQTVSICGAAGGQFQLHVMMPVMAATVLESVELMTQATHAFVEFCVTGLKANPDACQSFVERSLSLATALTPKIGYEQAAQLAHEALASGKTIRQLCQERKLLSDDDLQSALDPVAMTRPQE